MKKYIIPEVHNQSFNSIFIKNTETGKLVLTLWGSDKGGRIDVYLDQLHKDVPLHLIKGEIGKPRKSPDILNIMNTEQTKEGNFDGKNYPKKDDDIPEVTISLETYVKPTALPEKLQKEVIAWVKEQRKNEKR